MVGNKKKICGIYKITSPTGRVYIGQSNNIRKRFNSYKAIGSSIKGQIKIYNSLIKHGVENHIFEIVEECSEEDLNCRERYWQDFYDVLNGGLNCILQECGEKRRVLTEESTLKRSESKMGVLNSMSKEIINIETGIFYECIREACEAYNINRNYMKDMLSGKSKNKTSCIYIEDYEIGNLPNTLYEVKVRVKNKIKIGKEVVDFKTKLILGSTKDVAKSLNIKETTLRSYLKGVANNKTNYIYKEDLDRGLTPNTLCSNKKQSIKIIDFETLYVYNTIVEASNFYNVSAKYISDCLENINSSGLPIIKYEDYCEKQVYQYAPEKIKKRNNKILNLTKNITYNSIKEVSKDLGVSKDMLSKILNFKSYNYHNIIFERDYLDNIKPNQLFNYKKKPFIRVIDTNTNITYNSIRHVCRELNLSKSSHEKIKNGEYKNLKVIEEYN